MVLPRCGFCKKTALYDGKTHMGLWAYMCEDHFMLYGTGIGPDKGRVLVLTDTGTDLLPVHDSPFAIAGQVCAILRKSGKPEDVYNLAIQLLECEDSEAVFRLLSHYVHMHNLAPALQQPEKSGIEEKNTDPMRC